MIDRDGAIRLIKRLVEDDLIARQQALVKAQFDRGHNLISLAELKDYDDDLENGLLAFRVVQELK